MSLSKPTRPERQLIDIPWRNLNLVWNAQELEKATKLRRNWSETLHNVNHKYTNIVHHATKEKPQVATFEAASDDQLLPLLALGGK